MKILKLNQFIKENNQQTDWDDNDFYTALDEYGELTHDDLLNISDDKDIIINGTTVDSILIDGDDMCWCDANGNEYPLNLDDINPDILEKIYQFLVDNPNLNEIHRKEYGW